MSSYAIVIGINHYTPPQRDGLKTLFGAIPDSQKVYDWLIGPGGLPAANCKLIQSGPDPLTPIKNLIDRAISDIVRTVVERDNRNADRFYFYFAGHGMGIQGDRENNGMCMADWDEYMRDAATLSSSEYKRKFINEGLFKEVVMWMDCCRTTKLFLTPGASPGVTPIGPNDNPAFMVAFAAEFRSEAFEADQLDQDPRGIFTSVLLRGLNGDILLRNGGVDAVDLINYLAFHVPVEAQNVGFSQRPEIINNLNTTQTFNF
ncbi:MAG: caspase family protein [Mucilaginibacter sp.]|uniref:caspase family protein n=1 Tax=Mucilaginibacter sp. TaxID=1882438 RepID=UPI0032648A33